MTHKPDYILDESETLVIAQCNAARVILVKDIKRKFEEATLTPNSTKW